MLIYIFLLLSIITLFYNLFGAMYHISEKFYLLSWPQPPRVFTALTKPILFLYHHKGFHIVICLDDILVLVHYKWTGKRAHSFLCSLLVCLGSHINFSKSDLHLTQTIFIPVSGVKMD